MERKRGTPVRIAGFDLALNHGGAVLLQDGEMVDFKFLIDHKGAAAKSKGHGIHLEFPDSARCPDKQQRAIIRLLAVRRAWRTVLQEWKPDVVGIEDYAMRAEGHAYHIGEVGGVFRLLVLSLGIPKMRLHDPLSVKLFAAHAGNASKDEMIDAVRTRWGQNFSAYNKSEKDYTIEEDLADAFSIAKLVQLEHDLRIGKTALVGLPPKEIQVFNRVTKSYPVSLLAREWLGSQSE